MKLRELLPTSILLLLCFAGICQSDCDNNIHKGIKNVHTYKYVYRDSIAPNFDSLRAFNLYNLNNVSGYDREGNLSMSETYSDSQILERIHFEYDSNCKRISERSDTLIGLAKGRKIYNNGSTIGALSKLLNSEPYQEDGYFEVYNDKNQLEKEGFVEGNGDTSLVRIYYYSNRGDRIYIEHFDNDTLRSTRILVYNKFHEFVRSQLFGKDGEIRSSQLMTKRMINDYDYETISELHVPAQNNTYVTKRVLLHDEKGRIIKKYNISGLKQKKIEITEYEYIAREE